MCDGIMNDLWGSVLDSIAGRPENSVPVPYPFYDVFEAFDAGEYHRKTDKSDNPVAEHTDPMIAELLAKYLPDNGR